ncbi:uncharacterized protein PAC_19711 [Phialocephala subalpina]|uniref:Protein kinase domain-containing protein n=1 Tax=Phialocephala subalpina TaxID=576137 RepID=A0A1L7XXL4_9HELO|nr:uncharacterized protein PAC_19711 [Phialocephala subalpina]
MSVKQHAVYTAYLQAIAVTTRDVNENTTATTQLSLSHPLDISPTLSAPCSYDALLNMLSTALGCSLHESIVEYFTARRDGNSYTYLAPRPDCNLRTYWWKHPHVVYDESSVTWTLKQLNLIAGAVDWVHTTPLPDSPLIRLKYNAVDDSSQYRCHGEISSHNILWYGDDLLGAKQGVVGGSLKVIDFVVRRLAITSAGMNARLEDSSYRHFNPNNAPEGHLVPKSTVLTKAFDIWQLGCLYLEFVTWLLQGFTGVDEFEDFREVYDPDIRIFDEYFYDVTVIEGVPGPNGKGHAIASKKVVEWVDKLHRLPHCSQSIHDVLDLVMEHLLVIDPEKRMKCSLVEQRLSEIFRRAEEDHDYILKPAPRA